jgi:PhnB protein
MTQPIPEGYRTVTPYLTLDDATEAIEFYKSAFGAEEQFRMEAPNGKIGHAVLKIGDSLVMLSDAFPGASTQPPNELGGTTTGLFVYVEDADAVAKKALDTGAISVQEVQDQFWGDRMGTIKDPFGHVWSVATHVEDVPPDEMEKRAKEAMAAMSS